MTEVWSASRFGRAIGLVNPKAEQVDFYEICHTLADINRYNGSTRSPVSEALHTMIAFDVAEERDRAHVLIHDAGEARLGDWTAPAVQALIQVAGNLQWEGGRDDGYVGHREIVKETIFALKRRHDVVIHNAAGLPCTFWEQEMRIKLADNIALMTERRDFLNPCDRKWNAELEAISPAEHVYREGEYGWRPSVVAERLYARMKQYLPALMTFERRVRA